MSAALDELKAEIEKGSALVVVGAGISVGATGGNPIASWFGLLKSGIDRCLEVAHGLPDGWKDRALAQVDSCDLTDMVLAAQNIAERLKAPQGGEYRKWLRETVGALSPQETATIDALQGLNLAIATTNYDGILSQCIGRPPVTWRTAAAAQRWIRNDDESILHLHGHWETPDSVVLGIRTYDDILRDEATQTLLRSCLYCRTLLFVGYGRGLQDPNFAALLEWSRAVLSASEYWHYRLVLDEDVELVQAEHGADRVRVVGIGPSYDQLPTFIRSLGCAPKAIHKIQPSQDERLTRLIEGRADLHRRHELLLQRKSELSADEFISQLFDIAEAMVSLHGRKSAIDMLHGSYGSEGKNLSVAVRASIGLRLCEWLLVDREYEFARRLLADLHDDEICRHMSTSQLVETYRLSGECFFYLFSCADSIAAYCEAVKTESDDAQRDQLIECLLVASVLFGDRIDTEQLLNEFAPDTASGVRTADAGSVQARCLSMAGKTSEAVDQLRALTASAARLSQHELGKLQLLIAELLHLDGRDEEALAATESIQTTEEEGYPDEWDAVVRRNTAAIGFSLWEPKAARDFYDLVDEQRLARVSLRDTEAVLDAKQSAESGRHYDALPELWAEVRRTYHQGAWPIWRWALQNMSTECLQVGHLVEAFRFAVLALDDKACRSAAEALLIRGDRSEIDLATTWLLENANPLRAATVGSLGIETLADAFGKPQVDAVFQWLLPRCERNPKTHIQEAACRRAWKAISRIANRLESAQADRLCQVAISHRYWKNFDVERSTLRNAVGNCLLATSVDTKNLVALELAQATTAATSQTIEDRLTTLNLLVYACSQCDEQTKERVAEQLYPKGAKLTAELVLVSPKIVNRNLFSDGVDDWVKQITKELELEVQQLQPGEDPAPVSGSMMQYTRPNPDGSRHLVHIRDEISVKAAISRRHDMSDGVFDALLLAIERGIANPDNLLTNRITLVKLLPDAVPHLSASQAARLVITLATIAAGEIQSNIEPMTEEEARHPLNRYRFKAGSPNDLQAVSLTAIAEIEKAHASRQRRKTAALISKAAVSDARWVRCFAFRAWAIFPKLAPDVRLLALMATSDADQLVAREAFVAICEAEGSGFSLREWRALANRSALAAKSSARDLRWSVAQCLSRARSKLPNGAIRAKVDGILQQLSADLCYSVRSAATHGNPNEA